MPLLSASKKALRVSRKKTVQNAKVRSKLYRITKKVMKLIKLGERALAEQQLSEAYRTIDKAAKHGIIKPNKSAHMKSRLATAVSTSETTPSTKTAAIKTSAKRSKKTAVNVKTAPKNS
jgi:small subunit ribosomal protein S20